jgi:hypothetical protein
VGRAAGGRVRVQLRLPAGRRPRAFLTVHHNAEVLGGGGDALVGSRLVPGAARASNGDIRHARVSSLPPLT